MSNNPRLAEFARLTAADMGASSDRPGIESMRDNYSEVAATLGCTEDEILIWCDRELAARELIAELSSYSDGTDKLGAIVRQALAKDPSVTRSEIIQIIENARDKRVEEQAS